MTGVIVLQSGIPGSVSKSPINTTIRQRGERVEDSMWSRAIHPLTEGMVLNDKVKYVKGIDKSKPGIGVCLCED